MSVWLALAALAATATDAPLGASTRLTIHLTCSAGPEACERMYAELGYASRKDDVRTRYATTPASVPTLGLAAGECRTEEGRRICDGV